MWKIQMLYLDCIHYVYRRGGGGLKSFWSQEGGMPIFLDAIER